MAHFIGKLYGSTGYQIVRKGSKEKGIRAIVNGWHNGVTVDAGVNMEGDDVVNITPNGGAIGADKVDCVITVCSNRIVINAEGKQIIYYDTGLAEVTDLW